MKINLKKSKGLTPLEISKPRVKFLSGVTLIELLVVIAIIGILSVVSVVALSSAKSSRQVRVVADEIKDKILDARSYAVAPSTKTTEPVKDIKVTLTNKDGGSKASIEIEETRTGGGHPSDVFPEKKLPDNINFEFIRGAYGVSADGKTLEFNFSASEKGFIGQVYTPGESQDDFSFVVKNTSNSERYNLTINRFGLTTVTKDDIP